VVQDAFVCSLTPLTHWGYTGGTLWANSGRDLFKGWRLGFDTSYDKYNHFLF